MGLKDVYYSLEEKYYAALDRLNETIPVYSVIDPIDRVIPSFALLLGIIVLLVFGGLFVLLTAPALPAESTITFIVKNTEGRALENTKIIVNSTALEFDLEETTNKSGHATIKVPFGAELSVKAQKRNFVESEQNITADQEAFEVNISLSEELEAPALHTVSFAAPNGTKLVGTEVSATFECTNSLVTVLQPTQTTTNGDIEITPPAGCGLLTVRATSTGYTVLEGVIDLPAKLLTFIALPIPKGEALFFIKDNLGQSLNGIKASIFDEQNTPKSNPKYSDHGEVSFSLEPGNYRAVIEDETGAFPTKEESFSVSANSTFTKEIVLTKNPAATIKISVKDKDSGTRVDGAKVVLKKENGETIGEREISAVEQKAVFALAEKGVYKYIAIHEDYLPGNEATADLRNATPNSIADLVFELEKCTPERCGVLEVNVVDEDNKPVENADVFLYDAKTNSIAFNKRVTDFDGNVEAFRNAGEKEFYAVAQKYPATGKSETILVDPLKINTLTVKMQIGEGQIDIEAVDAQGTGIAFAQAEVKKSDGATLATVSLDEQGKGSFKTKADKQVFVIVSKDGYTNYTTVLYQVFKNDKIKVKAELVQQLQNTEIEVNYLGVFEPNGSAVTGNLTAGSTYTAKLQLLVPKDYKKTGLHFRVGKESALNADKVFIKSFNAPITTALASTSFTPPSGEAVDFANAAIGDAKWVNLVWTAPAKGIFEAEFKIVVKPETTLGAELPISYRAWGVNNADEFLRHPSDSVLQKAKETSAKQELYADVFSQNFFEGSQKICDSAFCYSERLLDLREGLVLNRTPYALRVFDDYKFEFEITNNGSTVFDPADFRVKNTLDGTTTDNTIAIKNYSITNADGVLFNSSTESFGFENPLDAGRLAPFRSIKGEMTLLAKQLKNSELELKIVSGSPAGVEVFNKRIGFEGVSGQEINAEVLPEVLGSLIPIDLQIKVSYSGGNNNGRPVEGARVVVTRIDPAFNETFLEATTGADGNAAISICGGAGCSPGTKIVIEVQKSGVTPARIEKEIAASVVQFTPESLEFNLDITDKTTEQIALEILNLIPSTLKVKRIVLGGSFDGIADIDRMASYLQQFSGNTQIEFGKTKQVNVLAALNNNAQFLEESVSPTGALLIDLTDLENRFTWTQKEIPLKMNVSLAQPPKEKNCLTLSINDWSDSALETSTQKAFSISNNCVTTSGTLLDLRNLQATINWSGEQNGQVLLTITSPTTGETVSQVLQQGVWSNFISSVNGGEEFLATLSFVPKPSKIGEAAVFDVKIDAEQLTASGQQFVGASNDISANLLIVNLSGCIKTDPGFDNVLELGKDDSGSFTISTEECGEIPIDLRLCYNDSGCRGGASEGGIGLSSTEFSNVANDSVSVQVRRESIPGIYGVKIEARPRGGGYREIGEQLVSIAPREGSAFDLSKYNFIIIGNGATDSATLTNTDLAEEVQVDASDCDWGTAEKESSNFFSPAGAGVGAAAAALLGAKPAIAAAQQASAAAAASRVGTALQENKSLDDSIKSTKDAIDQLDKMKTDVFDKASKALKEKIGLEISACEKLATGSDTRVIDELSNMAQNAGSEFGTAIENGNNSLSTLTDTQKNFDAVKKDWGGTGSDLWKDPSKVSDLGAEGVLGQALSSVTDAIGSVHKTADIVKNQEAFIDYSIAEVEFLKSTAQAKIPPDPAAVQACNNALASLNAYKTQNIVNMKDSLDQADGALNFARIDIDNAAQFMDKTAAEIVKLKSESANAENTQNGKGPENTKVDTFNEGRFFMVEGFYAGLGFLGGGLLPGLFSGNDDPCDERTQFNVVDWKINLKQDARNIELDKEGIDAEWNTREAFTFGEFDSQEVGVLFTNAGAAEPKPVYGIGTFSATKHIHTQPTIIQEGKSGFGQFAVPDSTIESYTQKFHLRFKTGETEQPIPEATLGAQSCVSGVSIGLSGEGALPKTRLDWNWKNFGIGSCEAGKPDSVYCDATQFNFEVMYRMDALKKFLDRNREKLSCPENPGDTLAIELAGNIPQQIAAGELPSSALDGEVSLVTRTFTATEDSLTVNVVIGNSSDTPQNATVQVTLTPPTGITVSQNSCSISFSQIPSNGTQAKSCGFNNLQESGEDYSVKVEIVNATTDIGESTQEFTTRIESYIDCWLPASTELYDGRASIDYFIEEVEPSIEWTNEIPDRQALHDLLFFDAFLIKDGYSDDFLNDFEEYSNQTILFDSPTFFTNGFDAYYKNKSILFRKKYADGEAVLSRGGTYGVELIVKWGGDWQFFDNQGKPFGTIEVLTQLKQEPSPNNPFYHIPFDGLVGKVGENSFSRQGYGTVFLNESEDKTIALNTSPPIARTWEGSGSNAVVNAGVEFKDDLFSLNSNPLSRGNILSIENSGIDAQIKFFPAVATPVMMKMSSSETPNPFGAFYGVFVTDNRTNVGDVLTYWSGAGACLDFSGTAVFDAFDDNPDRLAVAEDGVQNWENNYTVQWSGTSKKGDVFLKTIFYTDPQKLTELVAVEPDGLEFLSPDSGPANGVGLNGINGMEFNNAGKSLNAIQDVFDLVKSGQLCTTSTGNKVSFWWNPKTIFEQEGSAQCLNCSGQRSIQKEEDALVASQTCIGTS